MLGITLAWKASITGGLGLRTKRRSRRKLGAKAPWDRVSHQRFGASIVPGIRIILEYLKLSFP
jgi:hypothetical protein